MDQGPDGGRHRGERPGAMERIAGDWARFARHAVAWLERRADREFLAACGVDTDVAPPPGPPGETSP